VDSVPLLAGTSAAAGGAEASGGALLGTAEAEALDAEADGALFSSATAVRGGGAAQPVSPLDAGGAPPTISAVASIAHG